MLKLAVFIWVLLLTNDDTAAFKYNKRNGNNLCPQEYQLCLCNYTSTSNTIEHHNSDYMSKSASSLMIDCSKIQVDNMKMHVFAVIPRVSNAGASRNHLQQITQLDLSRTSISEIPTDAFHVNFDYYLFKKIISLQVKKLFVLKGYDRPENNSDHSLSAAYKNKNVCLPQLAQSENSSHHK